MMRPRLFEASSAIAAVSVRVVGMQLGLAVLVFALAVVWLRLPDSSAVSIVATSLLGLIVVAVASGGEVAILLRLCNQPFTRRAMFKGVVVLLAAVAVWIGWSLLISHFQAMDTLLAGYLNSRFPSSLRNAFSYSHLYQGFEWLGTALQWIGAGVLAVVVCCATASRRPALAMRCVMRAMTYWVVLFVGTLAAIFVTSLLMRWTAGHALGLEMLSLVLRLGVVMIFDAVIAVCVLAVVAACVVRCDAGYATPEGSPERSQERTADTP